MAIPIDSSHGPGIKTRPTEGRPVAELVAELDEPLAFTAGGFLMRMGDIAELSGYLAPLVAGDLNSSISVSKLPLGR